MKSKALNAAAGLILLAGVFGSASSWATVITFGGLPDGQLGTYIEGGFKITSSGSFGSYLGNYDNSGVGDLTSNTTGSTYISLTRDGGGTFSLIEFDFARRRGQGSGFGNTILQASLFNGGSTIGTSTFTTPGAGWVTAGVGTNVVDEVRFTAGPTGTAFMIDDIRVAAAVSEPGTVALLALGLLGAGCARKRRIH
jgi:hypothetical protein